MSHTQSSDLTTWVVEVGHPSLDELLLSEQMRDERKGTMERREHSLSLLLLAIPPTPLK